MQSIPVSEFLDLNVAIIDVRSEKEFAEGHIPGAINIPILNNENRAIVGTLYKQSGRDEAVDKGFELVGPHFAEMGRAARELASDGKLKIYCWRGGMRSQIMGWVLSQYGLECSLLQGGYKNYRNFLLEETAGKYKLLLLSGKTGSGKTRVLQALKEAGAQVIDLEALAHHRGSAFGALGLPAQPSTQQFQNQLYAELQKLDVTQPIWLESESLTIGRVYLPMDFWKLMNAAPNFQIEIPVQSRIELILEEYGNFSVEELGACIVKIGDRLGPQHVKPALQRLDEKGLAGVMEMLLEYYDKQYLFGMQKHKSGYMDKLEFEDFNAKKIATELILRAKKYGNQAQ